MPQIYISPVAYSILLVVTNFLSPLHWDCFDNKGNKCLM